MWFLESLELLHLTPERGDCTPWALHPQLAQTSAAHFPNRFPLHSGRENHPSITFSSLLESLDVVVKDLLGEGKEMVPERPPHLKSCWTGNGANPDLHQVSDQLNSAQFWFAS